MDANRAIKDLCLSSLLFRISLHYVALHCYVVVNLSLSSAKPNQNNAPVRSWARAAVEQQPRLLGVSDHHSAPPPTTSHRQSQQQQHSPQQSSLRTQLSSGDAGPLPGAEHADWRGYTDATAGNSSDTVKCCHSCCSSAAPLHSV